MITESEGARVIAVDRAGYGGSCFQSDRTYGSCADEVAQLLDHLKIEKAAVLGYSSGGPNAMACAAHQPSRFTSCGLISSDGPYSQMGGDLINKLFKVSEVTYANSLPRTVASHADLLSAYQSMKNEVRKALAVADLDRAVMQGLSASTGPSQDGVLEAGDWDFNLSALDTSQVPILLWHGEDDNDVPVSVANYLRDRISGARVQLVSGESHSMIRRRWGHFLSELRELQ